MTHTLNAHEVRRNPKTKLVALLYSRVLSCIFYSVTGSLSWSIFVISDYSVVLSLSIVAAALCVMCINVSDS